MDRNGGGGDSSADPGQRWALPFWCVLTTSPEVSERLGKRHKTVAMWAQQMISLVRRWLPGRSIKLMGDTAYSVLELGLHARHKPGDADHHWSAGCRVA
jgi:hypothetical protein